MTVKLSPTLLIAPFILSLTPHIPSTTYSDLPATSPSISAIKPAESFNILNPAAESTLALMTPPIDLNNLYDAGNCTWYAKSKRPDIPNDLGNADTWVYMASQEGFATGNTPRPGAIGQRGMHVVYVESVAGSLMTISEMNELGLGVISERTIPYDGWQFIY